MLSSMLDFRLNVAQVIGVVGTGKKEDWRFARLSRPRSSLAVWSLK